MKSSIKRILFIITISAIVYTEALPGFLERTGKTTSIGGVIADAMTSVVRILALSVECLEYAGWNITTIDDIPEDQLKRDPRYKIFNVCMLEKQNLLNTDGTMKRDQVKDYIAHLSDIKQEIILEKCLPLRGMNGTETAYMFNACYEDTKNLDDNVLKRNKLQKLSKECILVANVSEVLIKNLEEAAIEANTALKHYISCMFQKQNFQNIDGDININAVISNSNVDITKCPSLKGTDQFDTAYLAFKCFRGKIPLR